MKAKSLKATALLLLTSVPALAEELKGPAIIWFSAPVLPDETVMVYGDDWSEDAEVSATHLRNGEAGMPGGEIGGSGEEKQTLTPIQVGERSLSFVLPAAEGRSLVECRIEDGERVSDPFVVNEPTAWWTQSDWGAEASPGGWLRVFGRCLDFGGKARVVLVQQRQSIELPITRREMWSLNTTVPKNLAPGRYEVHMHNGLGGPGGWRQAGEVTVATHKAPWPSKVFRVVDFGAVANDQASDQPAVEAALRAVAENGGGVVHFPRGRCQLTGSLEVPPNTLLRGESLELSQIYWQDANEMPDHLIRGGDGFGMRDLFVHAGHHNNGIVCQDATNVFIKRVRIRMLKHQYVTGEEYLRRSAIRGRSLILNAENLHVEDCDIYTDGSHSFSVSARYGIMARNRLRGHGGGGIGSCDKFVYEENTVQGGGHSFGPNRNVYWGHNKVGQNFVHDRESVTFDGGGHAFKGGVTACKGKQMVLDQKLVWRHRPEYWIGKYVFIMNGRGAGQARRLVRNDRSPEIEVDRPWVVEPDESSFVMISHGRERVLFVGNEIEDSTVALQFYGSLVEGVQASNTSARTGGFHSYGMQKGGGPEPSWYMQFIDNVIKEGNAYRGPQNGIPVSDAHIQIRDRGCRERIRMTRCCLIRRCDLQSNAHLAVTGDTEYSLVENCRVANADAGVLIDSRSREVILRGNRFDKVREPYRISAADTLVHIADRALGALAGASGILGEGRPASWPGIMEKLDALSRVWPPDEDAPEETADLFGRAVRDLAASGPDPVSPHFLKVLLGFDIGYATHTFLPVVDKGARGNARMLAMPHLGAWAPPCRLSCKVGEFDGWVARCGGTMPLTPGKGARLFMDFTMPEGPKGAFRLPVAVSLEGKDWALKSEDAFARDTFAVRDWLVAGPFENKSRQPIDTTVHPPEIKLDLDAKYATLDGERGWEPAQTDKGGTLNLASCFEARKMAAAHAVAVLRCARELHVRLSYRAGGGALVYVNGERVGTEWRWSQWECLRLNKGENVVRVISSVTDGAWSISLNVKVLGSGELGPTDIAAIPATELAQCKALRPASGTAALEGKALPHSLGIDWKLVYDDNFDRQRIGQNWEGRTNAGWMSSQWKIADGHVMPVDAWSTLAFKKEVRPPLRVEYDVYREHKGTRMLGTLLCPKGQSLHRYWGKLYGYGYYMCLGWHDDFSNSMMRNEKRIEVQEGEKALQLEPEKWYHVAAMFVPPRGLLYVDDKLVFEYEDPDWIKGLNEFALFSYPIHQFDNVRIYQAK